MLSQVHREAIRRYAQRMRWGGPDGMLADLDIHVTRVVGDALFTVATRQHGHRSQALAARSQAKK